MALKRYIPYLAILAIVFSFFAFVYPFHLRDIEQLQLFQSTSSYFTKLVARPGGISMYVGRFLSQFFITPAIGALIIAVLTTIMFFSIEFLLRKNSYSKQAALIISLLSASLLSLFSALMSGFIASLFGCLLFILYKQLTNEKTVLFTLPIFVIVTYCISGGLFTLAWTIFELLERIFNRNVTRRFLVSIICAVVLLIALPIFARHLGLPHSMLRAFIGPDFYKYINVPQSLPYIIAIAIALSSIIYIIPKSKIWNIIMWGISIGSSCGCFISQLDMKYEKMFEYDYYARTRQWDKVIALADKQTPELCPSVMQLNLALAMTNQLGDKMFRYKQFDVSGLVPKFEMDVYQPMMTNDVLYNLGFVNMSECYAFEASKAMADHQESVRTVKRLAEVNIIKGNYELAKKYLRMLENTFFYADWAHNSREYIDKNQTSLHPEWRRIRSWQGNEDFFYNWNQLDIMLGNIFMSKQQNKVAFDYLMAYYLLNRDLNSFCKYAPLGKNFYQDMPTAFREAYLLYLHQTNPDVLKTLPMGSPNQICNARLNSFLDVHNKNNKQILQNNFSDTYWYFYFQENE